MLTGEKVKLRALWLGAIQGSNVCCVTLEIMSIFHKEWFERQKSTEPD